MLRISLTDIQWGSFSPLVALSLHELLVCPPSLHKINTCFVHNCPLWPQSEATPFICLPHTHTHICMFVWPHMIVLVFVFERTLAVCLCECVWNWDVWRWISCVDSFSPKRGVKCWSTCSAQVNPSHPFEPPVCVLRSCVPPCFLPLLCRKK